MKNPTIAKAKGLGRYGDTELVHMSKPELAMMNAQTPGGLTTNPDTGLPEAFNWGSLLGAIAPLAMFIPGVGPAITGGLEAMGASSGVASALAPALLGFGGTLAGGGNLQSALMSGVGAGVMGGIGGAANAGNAAAQTAAQTAANTGGIARSVAAAPEAAQIAADVPQSAMASLPTLAGGDPNMADLVTSSAGPTVSAAAMPTGEGMWNNANILNGGIGTDGIATANALTGGSTGLKKYLMPAMLGAMGLSALNPSSGMSSGTTAKPNPYAGRERQANATPIAAPSGYVAGGSGGEWSYYPTNVTDGSFYIPGVTTSGYPSSVTGYADGGAVGQAPYAPQMGAGHLLAIQDQQRAAQQPVYNPGLFANNWHGPQIQAPTALVGAYGDTNPGTYNDPTWVKPTPVVQPPPTTTTPAQTTPSTTTVPTAYGNIPVNLQSILANLSGNTAGNTAALQSLLAGAGAGQQTQVTPINPAGGLPALQGFSLGASTGYKFGGYIPAYANGGDVGPGMMGPNSPSGAPGDDGMSDGSSDSVPAMINGKTPAKLSQGEFVVPSDVVSHLGNGSSQAGAARLQGLVHGVRKMKTGHPGMPPRI